MVTRRTSGHLASVAVTMFIGSAAAQTCNTLLGDANCAAGAGSLNVPALSGGSTGPAGFSVQSLGRDLSFGGNQPGYFGAITFQGGRATCAGLFRARDCSTR